MNRKFKITFNAPVTLTLVLISFIVTLAGSLTGGLSTQALFMTYHSPLTDPLTYVRFFTHIFGHAGWDHFIGNAMYLLLLGPTLEEKYGPKVLTLVIVVTAAVTGIANYIFFPDAALCGASGVVFAFIMLISLTGVHDREIPLTFILVAILFIGQQVLEGLFAKDNISQLTHILGGGVGTVLGYRINTSRR